MEKTKKIRNSNIELLRIISMLFIVMSHYSVHGNTIPENLSFGINQVLLQISRVGGLGVAIFVMISGYYLSSSKFRISKIIQLEFQVLFYTIPIFAIFCIFDKSNLCLSGIVNSFLPTISNVYWFYTAYIILLFVFPYINSLLSQFDRKQFCYFIIVLSIFFSVLPTFFNFNSFAHGGYLSLFLIYYCIGAYIRKYPLNLIKRYKYIILFLCTVGMVVSVLCFDLIGSADNAEHFYSRSSIFSILLAASLLAIFIDMPVKTNKLTNAIGGSTFGVYLIHDNYLIRDFLWKNIFNNSHYANSKLLIIHFITSVLIVFVVCAIIEFSRKQLTNNYLTKLTNALVAKFYDKFPKLKDVI